MAQTAAKVTIVGAGLVGSTVAYTWVTAGPFRKMV